MATTPTAGSGDPSVLRQIERQNAALTTRPQLSAAPSVTGTSGTPTSTVSNNALALAPVVNGSETLYPLSTATTSSNAITITSSISNDTGDVTTVYAAGGRVTATAINQTINQFTAVDSGVSQILAGNGVTITSTGADGKGVVTVSSSTTFGNIVNINLNGNANSVLRGDGTWGADANSSYGNSNVVSLMASFGSNTITTTGNVSVGNIIGNGQALTGIAGANVSGFVPNANVANTAFAVAAANVTGLGNIATINLTGSTSNVLYGNGVFAPAAGGNVSELVNGNNSLVLDGDGNIVLEGTPSGNAINRGLVWDYGANANGVNSTIRQDNGGLTVRAWTENGGGANGYSAPVSIITNQDAAAKAWEFDGQGNLTVPTGSINSINDGGDLGAYITLTPDLGLARLAARDAQTSVNYTNTSWSTATYTGTQIDFTNAPDLVAFFNSNQFNVGINQTFSINGGEPVPFTGYTIGVSNAVTVYTDVTPEPDPTTVTSIDFLYQLESYVAIDYDGSELNINATGLTINIDNDQTEGPDIVLRSGDDITLQAKDMSLGSEREGGDINLYAGDGADDDGLGNTSSTGGDILIDAGRGGDGNTGSGSQGGFTRVSGGTGGTAGLTNAAGPGGYVSIEGGDGGSDGGNTSLGAVGGNVSITAGLTTQEGVNGPNVVISSGQAGPNALAGYVDIFTPASANGFGGTWRFDGDGKLTFPGTPRIDTYTNNFEVQAAENINFEANAVVNIYTDTGNAAYQWQFGDDGNLILAGGSGVIQSIANSSLDPTLPNVSTMTFTPDQNYSSQSLVLDPTAPGHIHLRASAFSNIDDPAANIFLGGEDTSFEVTSGANNQAVIHSGGNNWTFGNDGNLTIPGNISSNGIMTLRGGNTDVDAATAGNVSIYSGYNSNANSGYGGNILIAAGTGNTANGNIVFSTSGANVVTVTEYSEVFVDGTFLLGDYTGTNAQATIQVAGGDPRMILANYANGNASSAYYPDRILFGTDDYFGSIGQNQGFYISNTTTNSEINLNLFTGNGRIYINDGDNAGFYANGGSLQSYNASGNGFYSNTTIAYHTGNFSAANVQANTAFQLPVYSDNTARDTAIVTPTTGMMVFVTGSGMQVRGATAWNVVSGTAT